MRIILIGQKLSVKYPSSSKQLLRLLINNGIFSASLKHGITTEIFMIDLIHLKNNLLSIKYD